MTTDEIRQLIEKHVPNSTAYVFDPMNDGQHLEALVISPAFEEMPLVKQHKMVMEPLKEGFAGPVHALGLKTFTPDKWRQVRGQYGFN